MNSLDRIKNYIEKNNPIAQMRRKRMRKNLTNENITFLTPNCVGGILFHDLNLKFLSPTVNLMLNQKDFLQFVLNLDEYLNGEFEFYHDAEKAFPCAFLKGDGVPAINIFFTHYSTEKEALDSWNRRVERIKYDNMFIFIEERDGITKEDLLKLATLRVKGIVAFTCNNYPEIPYSVFISKYNKMGEVGNILARNYLNDSREYEKYFDFVKWFNEANGGTYNVSSYKR